MVDGNHRLPESQRKKLGLVSSRDQRSTPLKASVASPAVPHLPSNRFTSRFFGIFNIKPI